MQRRDVLRVGGRVAAAGALGGLVTSGRAARFSGPPILIGSSLALSGILAGLGQDMVAGTTAAFSEVNAAGGIAGRELQLQALDDGYTPARTADNAKNLIGEPQVLALLSCVGTGNVTAILPLVERAGVPLVGPVTGAASLRQQGQRYVFHVRASYRDETQRLLQQLLSVGLSSMAVVYLDNTFGQEVRREAEAAFARHGLRSAGSFALAVDGSNGAALAAQVLAARPGAVLLGTTGTATTAFLLPLRQHSPSLPVAGLSVSVIQSERARLGAALLGLALTQVMPDTGSQKLLAVRRYLAAMQAANLGARVGGSSFEGWVNAQVVIEGLRRAGPDLRRERLRDALAGLSRLDLGGLTLGFGDQAPYVASQFVELAVLGAGGRRVS